MISRRRNYDGKIKCHGAGAVDFPVFRTRKRCQIHISVSIVRFNSTRFVETIDETDLIQIMSVSIAGLVGVRRKPGDVYKWPGRGAGIWRFDRSVIHSVTARQHVKMVLDLILLQLGN